MCASMNGGREDVTVVIVDVTSFRTVHKVISGAKLIPASGVK